jgi:hypothetical protein
MYIGQWHNESTRPKRFFIWFAFTKNDYSIRFHILSTRSEHCSSAEKEGNMVSAFVCRDIMNYRLY